MSAGFTPPPGPVCSIDVECVAVGTDHNSRAVGQVSIVDQFGNVLLNVYVKPEQKVVSYLTPLTGRALTKELLDGEGVPLQQALDLVRQRLPPNAVLVGQNISKDVQWLGLKEGQDFQQMMDLAGLYRVWNAKYKSYSVYGQDHLVQVLLGWDTSGGHDAVGDAQKSVQLFALYQQLQTDPAAWQRAQDLLLSTQPEPSFARKNPSYDGVCMGNRKTCTCGGPFFF